MIDKNNNQSVTSLTTSPPQSLFILNMIKIPRLLRVLQRPLSSTTKKPSSEPEAFEKQEYYPIFRCPLITVASVLNKFKKYQLYSAGAVIPASFAAFAADLCSSETTIAISTVGIASTIGVFSVGQIFNRMVGIIYVSKDADKVKISYLNFWGERENLVVDVKDICSMNETAYRWTDRLYREMYTKVTDKPFKITFRSADIFSVRLFIQIFDHDPEND